MSFLVVYLLFSSRSFCRSLCICVAVCKHGLIECLLEVLCVLNSGKIVLFLLAVLVESYNGKVLSAAADRNYLVEGNVKGAENRLSAVNAFFGEMTLASEHTDNGEYSAYSIDKGEDAEQNSQNEENYGYIANACYNTNESGGNKCSYDAVPYQRANAEFC